MQKAAIAAAALHIGLLAAYTLPAPWVPSRLRYWSQAYARVLFHQDWRLFAPDPPRCSCSLAIQRGTERIPMEERHDHFIWSRMAANACRFAEASPRADDPSAVEVPEVLARSIERMSGLELERVRMVRTCPGDGVPEVTSLVRSRR